MKPKKVTSGRVCPNCGSRATKIFCISKSEKSLHCQVCKFDYDPPEVRDNDQNH